MVFGQMDKGKDPDKQAGNLHNLGGNEHVYKCVIWSPQR